MLSRVGNERKGTLGWNSDANKWQEGRIKRRLFFLLFLALRSIRKVGGAKKMTLT